MIVGEADEELRPAGRVAIVVIEPIRDFVADQLEAMAVEVLLRRDTADYSVFHYRPLTAAPGDASTVAAFEAGIYDRALRRVEDARGREVVLTTVYGLDWFDRADPVEELLARRVPVDGVDMERVLDAAAEGARFAALADNEPADGVARTRALITEAIGADYATDVRVATGEWRGHPAITVTVRATLPVVGLLGVGGGLEVEGHAAREFLD